MVEKLGALILGDLGGLLDRLAQRADGLRDAGLSAIRNGLDGRADGGERVGPP